MDLLPGLAKRRWEYRLERDKYAARAPGVYVRVGALADRLSVLKLYHIGWGQLALDADERDG